MSSFDGGPRALGARGGIVLLIALASPGCGGGDDGGGGGGVDAAGGGAVDAAPPDADISAEPMLVDQIGCHMLGDYDQPVAVPAYEGSETACIEVLGPFTCLVHNVRTGSCTIQDTVRFEWEAGNWYNVKAFGWTVESSSHGEVTTQTNADSGILGVPVSTRVTATITHDSDGKLWDVVFRMEDEYVVFEKVDPPEGW